MAYNNYFPASYQPVYQQNPYPYGQPMPQQSNNYYPQNSYAQPAQNTNGITWVQGEAAAKAYPVAPGQNALLMDSEGECFYIKSTDATGMPLPLRTFEYHEVISAQPAIGQSNDNMSGFNPNDYVSRSEYDELKKELEELKAMNGSSKSPQQYTKGGKN